MFSSTSFQIKVSVVPEYDVKNSFPSGNRHVFQYTIIVENQSDFSIKLLKRKWLIYDVGFGFTEVIGDGVIGLTPEIQPGDSFTYFSTVVLRSGVGNMTGVYYCKQLLSNTNMEIEIPKFNLVSQVLSN
jgi:ApaG protein